LIFLGWELNNSNLISPFCRQAPVSGHPEAVFRIESFNIVPLPPLIQSNCMNSLNQFFITVRATFVLLGILLISGCERDTQTELVIPALPPQVDAVQIGMTRDDLYGLNKRWSGPGEGVMRPSAGDQWGFMGFPNLPPGIALGDPIMIYGTCQFGDTGGLIYFSINAGPEVSGPRIKLPGLMAARELCAFSVSSCTFQEIEEELGKGLRVGRSLTPEMETETWRWSGAGDGIVTHLDAEVNTRTGNLVRLEFTR